MQNKTRTTSAAARPKAAPSKNTSAKAPVQKKTAPARKPYTKAPAKSAGASKRTALIVVLGLLAFIIASPFLTKFFSGLSNGADTKLPAIDAARSIRITEVMSSNGSAIQDETGVYPDWFEVTNMSDQSVNLHGYKVAKDTNQVLKYFSFPDHTLKAGESTIVFCTSTSKNYAGYTYHAPFKLAAAGDTLILFNKSDIAIQTLNIPALSTNQSYAEISGEWVVTDEYTPFYANTSENHLLVKGDRALAESPIQITEIMAKNVSYAPDENGEFLDWIEIYNSASYSVSLNGYALSDSEDNLQKWRFPNISIGAGEYMLIYASGYDRSVPGQNLHTNFRLSTEKEAVILTNPAGSMIDLVEYDLLKADQSYSRQVDSSWTTLLPATPGKSNSYNSAALIESQFAAQNASGVFINEVMASTSIANSGGSSYDWVEIVNRSSQTVDLSGWGLSDDPETPRKWQFPSGSTISPGQYVGILLSELDKKEGSYYHTNFRLSASEGAVMTLSYPDGTIFDRVPLPQQYSNISYGRIDGKSGFYYMTATTPLTKNATVGYESRMQQPSFSIQGGVWENNEVLTLELTAEPGATIYYTLDASTPSPSSVGGKTYTPDPKSAPERSGYYETIVYTAPIQISSTTVVRAISVMDGNISSIVNTQTYLMGVSHTMDVVSLVMDPIDLWDYNKGLYVYGPKALEKYPYGSLNSGANFWMTWEKDGNLEYFSLEGDTLISQGCGVLLHGQYSRAESQKPFKLVARSKYGANRFNASLFENRDYTEYQSVVLRSSGQDFDKTHMRDSILTSLTAGSSVMYQDTTLTIVYLNGEYWGEYNLRERINTFSICQWEGWDESLKDSIDLVKGNTKVMKGSVDTWLEIKEWYAKNGIETEEELAYVKQYVDVDNYLEYVAVQMFTGNTDLLNVKKYRCEETDGKWRWIFFDTDWAFYTDTNSVRRWLTPGGVGTGNKTDNSLFIALMKNPTCKDQFLTYFAEKLRTTWSSDNVLRLINERAALLEPEIDQHLARWNITRSKYDSELDRFIDYAKERPGRLLYFYSNVLSRSEMEHYFGDLLDEIKLIDDKGKAYQY